VYWNKIAIAMLNGRKKFAVFKDTKVCIKKTITAIYKDGGEWWNSTRGFKPFFCMNITGAFLWCM
jgi:hypothetical protein